jgi:hypothetical protein
MDEDDERMMVSLGPNICLSGGAEGADHVWGCCAGSAGHTVIHFHFKGHKSSAPQIELVELTTQQLQAADEHVNHANITLKRRFPTSKGFTNNLLRRSWYQVENSERCYAVAIIKNGMVQGGTAWATQMFIDKYSGAACECYVFCQDANKWFKWEGFWQEILSPPVPHGVWTGIGLSDIKTNGKETIRKLLGWKNERTAIEMGES